MKKIFQLFLFCLLAGSVSCSSSSDPAPEDNPPTNGNPGDSGGDDDPDPGSLSYAADIRPIFQSNCTSCHGNPPTQNAPMSLTTLQEIMDAVDNRGLLGRINNTANPMPPTGLLPSTTRQRIEDWVDLGFPE